MHTVYCDSIIWSIAFIVVIIVEVKGVLNTEWGWNEASLVRIVRCNAWITIGVIRIYSNIVCHLDWVIIEKLFLNQKEFWNLILSNRETSTVPTTFLSNIKTHLVFKDLLDSITLIYVICQKKWGYLKLKIYAVSQIWYDAW